MRRGRRKTFGSVYQGWEGEMLEALTGEEGREEEMGCGDKADEADEEVWGNEVEG